MLVVIIFMKNLTAIQLWPGWAEVAGAQAEGRAVDDVLL